jgi:hypothetical protein
MLGKKKSVGIRGGEKKKKNWKDGKNEIATYKCQNA